MTQDTERIRVGEEADSGEPVELPVIDVLAGRGFITGKSGSGKSNSASVVAEQLLEAGYGLLIVDIDGEYYGLKEEYELLHAGADEECDIRVSPEHAGKLASLALEENVPIILDISSYLDPADADEMLLAVARQLFAKAKKQKKPFLVLVEECHEYIPEGGGMTETGKMLIKIGKRGRKHGLGIVGMSQRPADVKKDFITQCDWMVWHRLTWDNDTRVVGRILGTEYADRVEELGDGEAFLDTDWTDDLRRVQFDRKRTFDAGATPGLEEFERPDLQSVSDELVADLQEVSEERERHESELAALESELETKQRRIEELEAELAEARDMSEMADRFAQALVDNADAPAADTPAESDVAEAEEFVADDHAAPEREATDPDEALGAPHDHEAEELLPEEQRDLGAYAVSDGGEREADADSDADPDTDPESGEEPVETQDDTPDTSERSSGLKPVRTISSSSEEREADGDDESRESEPAEGDFEEAAGDSPQESDPTTETADGADADEPADETDIEPAETESGIEASVTEADSEESAEEAATESAEEEPAADAPAEADDPAAFELEHADEEGTTGTELEAEPETWDEQPDTAAEPVPDQDDKPFEATGDWPTPDGERTAHDTEAGDPEPPTDPERTAELEREIAEEFGVTMESGSNLTGGSLGSSTGDADSARGDATEDEPEPVAEDDSATASDPDSETESESQADETEDAEPTDDETAASADPDDGGAPVDPTADRGERLTALVEETEIRNEEGVVQVFVHGIEALDEVTRGMLQHYRNAGEVTPVDAHVAAGGSGERQYAYARNRTLRTAGVVEHVGAGRYRYRLPDLVSEVFDGNVDDETLSETVSAIEEAAGLAE